MKAIVLILAAALLAGCSAYGCDSEEAREISFSSVSDRDTVTAVSSGDCASAVATLTVTTSAGEILFQTETPLATLVRSFRPRPTRDEARAALGEWAQLSVSYTALAPPWEALGEAGQAGLERRSYEAVRARQWRMICPRISAVSEACLYWDEAARRAVPFYQRRVTAE